MSCSNNHNNHDSKLVIAKYNGEIVHISQYQESVHKGKLLCPFCNPPIRVTGVAGEFFRAWPNEGGHNCKKANIEYFDTDWIGKRYVEVISNKGSGVSLLIDINALVRTASIQFSQKNLISHKPKNSKHLYPRYSNEEKVFRSIVKTVIQMKSIITKNSLDELKGISYSFKTGANEILHFDDIVIRSDEIHTIPEKQNRFCILIVNSIKKVDNCIHLDSTVINGNKVIGIVPYPYDINNFPNFEKQCVISFGEVTYDKNDASITYLTIPNDFMIQNLDDTTAKKFFSLSQLTSVKDIENNQETPIITPNPTNLNNHNDDFSSPIDTLKNEINVVPSKKSTSRFTNISVEIINQRSYISKPVPKTINSERVSTETKSQDLTMQTKSQVGLGLKSKFLNLFRRNK